MFARLTTTQLAANERDATAEVVPELLPTLRGLDGFKGIIVASEGDGRRVVALSLWETAEALQANKDILDGLRDAETVGRNVDSQESAAFRVVTFDLAN
jgi:heme-degrading monooxygenase HmoA